jgi:hypothetical protein
MDATEWLRQVALGIPGMSAAMSARLSGFAPRLRAEFPEGAFSTTTAADVVEGWSRAPTYPELREKLESLGPFARPAMRGDDETLCTMWHRFIGRRLAEGGDTAHLLSLARAHCPDSGKDHLLRALFPAFWRREQDTRAEIARDKLAWPARRVTSALAPPRPPSGPSGAKTPAEAPTAPRSAYLPTEMFTRWQEKAQ